MVSELLLSHGVLDIRGPDEEPFTYSSGNQGPGYVMIKGLVSNSFFLRNLINKLVCKISNRGCSIDFVAGNVTGGIIPGWLIAEYLGVPFVYIRNTRKEGGQKEHITGLNTSLGSRALIVEELVNFAQTTCNSAKVLRQAGFVVTHAATILSYDHPSARQSLIESGIELISLITLPELLNTAQKIGMFSTEVIDNYRKFLNNPQEYQDDLRSR